MRLTEISQTITDFTVKAEIFIVCYLNCQTTLKLNEDRVNKSKCNFILLSAFYFLVLKIGKTFWLASVMFSIAYFFQYLIKYAQEGV